MLAVTDFVKAAGFIVLLVLLPTVPMTLLLSRPLWRRSARGDEVASGRSPATPFTVISIVGTGIAAFALLTLGIIAVGQWIAG